MLAPLLNLNNETQNSLICMPITFLSNRLYIMFNPTSCCLFLETLKLSFLLRKGLTYLQLLFAEKIVPFFQLNILNSATELMDGPRKALIISHHIWQTAACCLTAHSSRLAVKIYKQTCFSVLLLKSGNYCQAYLSLSCPEPTFVKEKWNKMIIWVEEALLLTISADLHLSTLAVTTLSALTILSGGHKSL